MLTSEQRSEIQRSQQNIAERLSRAPKLSAETVIEYLDWVVKNLDAMPPEHIAHRLNAAELVVRVHMGNVQGKATQHTLVEDGTIAPPPPRPLGVVRYTNLGTSH
jgi:hypothetical protein